MEKMSGSFGNRILNGVSRLVTRRPGWVIICASAISALAMIAAGNIETRTKIQDMLPEDNPQVVSYTEIDELFSGGSTTILVLEGTDRKRLIAAADALVAEIKSNDTLITLSRSVNYGIDEEFVSEWGLVLQDAKDLERTVRLFKQTDLLSYITAINESVEDAWTGDNPDEDLETFRQEADAVAWLNQIDLGLSLIDQTLSEGNVELAGDAGTELAHIFAFGDLSGFNDTGTMLTVNLLPNFTIVDMDKVEAFMREVTIVLDDVGAQYPDIQFSYTGEVPIQADEQNAMNFDMTVPALVAVVLILALFIATFPRFSTVIYIIVSLIAGIIFTYGLIGITIRVVNMLTSVMAVLLVGLGVDYGIQMAANYHTFRHEDIPVVEAMNLTYDRAGMGIVLAALTTSVAFFVMAATGSIAFRQFGFVLGSGILFCLVTMMAVLPSFLVLTDRARQRRINRRLERRPGTQRKEIRAERRVIEYGFLAAAAQFVIQRRKCLLVVFGVATVSFLGFALFGLKMDYDLMAMEPQGMPSIVTYKKVMDSYGITPFQSMIIANNLDEARNLVKQLEDRNQVADLASISYLVPDEARQIEALEIIREIRAGEPRYKQPSWDEERIDQLVGEIRRLEWNVIEMADLSVAGLGDGNRIQKKRDQMIREILGAEAGKPGREVFQKLISRLGTDPDGMAESLNVLDAAFGPALSELVDSMAAVDRPVTVEDVPESIRKRFFAQEGTKNLVYIYPRSGIMTSADTMRHFNEQLAAVDTRITGSAQIAVAWLDDAVDATLLSALFIFISVVAFLALMLRDVRNVIRAVIPLVVGLIWMLGLYALFGLKLNFLNLAVIPLVIGMGIDFGIHLTHRHHIEADIMETYRTTGKAVFLSGATTLIGFGSLGLIGKFPSIASVGSILAFGIGTCLLAAFLVLPILLSTSGEIPASGYQEVLS